MLLPITKHVKAHWKAELDNPNATNDQTGIEIVLLSILRDVLNFKKLPINTGHGSTVLV